MSYTKALPPVNRLVSLAKSSQFPATCEDIVSVARGRGYSKTMTDFLMLFAADAVFDSRDDFTTRCEELELIITQAQLMPREILRSPQD